jgi:hypothetical protein
MIIIWNDLAILEFLSRMESTAYEYQARPLNERTKRSFVMVWAGSIYARHIGNS